MGTYNDIRFISYVLLNLMLVSRLSLLMKKPDMISIRIPSDLLRQIDTIKEREGIDRTALIIRALRYWVAVDGNVTTDNEYLNRLEKLEKNMAVIADGIESVKELRERAAEQEKVIRVLMQMIQ